MEDSLSQRDWRPESPARIEHGKGNIFYDFPAVQTCIPNNFDSGLLLKLSAKNTSNRAVPVLYAQQERSQVPRLFVSTKVRLTLSEKFNYFVHSAANGGKNFVAVGCPTGVYVTCRGTSGMSLASPTPTHSH